MLLPVKGGLNQGPVGLNVRRKEGLAQGEDAPGGELPYAFIDRGGGWDILVHQKGRQRVPVKLRLKAGDAAKQREIGGEGKEGLAPFILHRPVVERLFPGAVAGHAQDLPLPVVYREGKHALTQLERLLQPPGLDGLQQDLRIGVAAEFFHMPFLQKRVAQLGGVVDLAVVAQNRAARGRDHGLRPRGGQIQDRKAAVPQRPAGLIVQPEALGVRPAMAHAVGHGMDERMAVYTVVAEAGNTTHRKQPPEMKSENDGISIRS